MNSLSPIRYRRIVIGAGALLTLIVVTGAAVRLTDSGLGCTDWPKCSEDEFIPPFAYHDWVEFGNRLLTGVVSVGVIAAVLGALRRKPKRRDLTRLAWGLVAGVAAQAVWGGVLVLADLHPALVAGHFIISMVLLWNVILLYVRADSGPGPAFSIDFALTSHLRLMSVLCVLVVLTGTVVTGTGPNGGDARADRLSYSLKFVAQVHSVSVWAFLAVLIALAWRSSRSERSAQLTRALYPLIAVAAFQGVVGYAQYFTGVPPLLVLVHVVGATALFCGVVWTHLSFFERPPEALAN